MKQYDSVRALLNDRRYAEMEIVAVQRQIDRICISNARTGTGDIPREKVPGKDEWVIRPRGTNNPEGAALQHFDGYSEALFKLLDSKRDLLEEAERVLDLLDDAVDRTILRYYYCQAQTDEQIAETIHFERRAVCKRRNEAVDELEKRWRKNTA